DSHDCVHDRTFFAVETDFLLDVEGGFSEIKQLGNTGDEEVGCDGENHPESIGLAWHFLPCLDWNRKGWPKLLALFSPSAGKRLPGLMKLLSANEHRQHGLHAFFPRFRLLRCSQSPRNRVDIRLVQSLEEASSANVPNSTATCTPPAAKPTC